MPVSPSLLENYRRIRFVEGAAQMNTIQHRLAEALRAIIWDCENCDWSCERCGKDYAMKETDLYSAAKEALREHDSSASAQPRFTLDKPTVEGWYWMNDQGSGIEVVRVFKRPGHDYLCIYGEPCMGKRDFVAVARTQFQWCGPLPLPAAPSAPNADEPLFTASMYGSAEAATAAREKWRAENDAGRPDYCPKHRRWPCAECGTSHYKGCKCGVCNPGKSIIHAPNADEVKP
jgi:hypothetical protein